MALIAPKRETTWDFEEVAAGAYIARIYRIIELGTHEEEYKGKAKRVNKILFSWELPLEKRAFKEGEEEKPLAVHARYNLSMFKGSKMREMIEGLLGMKFTDQEAYQFDIRQLMGIECMINVVHETKGDRTFVNVQGVTPLPKGTVCPEAINEPVMLNFQDWDEDIFEGFSDNLKEQIKSSEEYPKMKEADDFLDTAKEERINPKDIPF